MAAHQEIAIHNQSAGEQEHAERKSTLTDESTQLSRAIANITMAIAEAGHSDALLDALKLKESRRAQVRTELDQISTPIQRVPNLTPEQIETASKKLIHALNNSPPEQLRQLLRGIIHEVVAERDGNVIRGMITYYYPPVLSESEGPPFDFAPTVLPKEPAPVGALLHRQLFSHPFEINIRSL
ncbi:MAG TPA: hypothetical protein VJ987_05350 [Anaerolineales bacterium]|nr:hypothetical protein [Anaerolineales bacterium]